MTDQNLANLKFIGYGPSHFHYFQAFVVEFHGPLSYFKYTGHIFLLLKSGAIDSYSKTASSSVWHQWPFI